MPKDYKKVADNIYLMHDLVRGKKRNKPYKVHIHRNGNNYIECFTTLGPAKVWRDAKLNLLNKPKEHQQIQQLEDNTPAGIISRYIKEVSKPKGRDIEAQVLLSLIDRKEFLDTSLYDFSHEHAQRFIDTMLTETYTRKGWKTPKNRTTAGVKRDYVHRLKRIWNVAKHRWGFKLDNPWISIENLEGWKKIRRRSLEDGELEKLIEASKGCRGFNKYYVPLAIYLVTETGMRAQEVFNLHWNDIDFKERVIHITKRKTDKKNIDKGLPPGGYSVLTAKSQHLLTQVASMKRDNPYDSELWDMPNTNERIFPLTLDGNERKHAFRQVWSDLFKRAKLECVDGEPLQFRDLRKVARRMFEDADLNEQQVHIMMGHAFEGMDEIYLDKKARLIKLKRIRDKLDRYLFNGKTMDEAYKEAGRSGISFDESQHVLTEMQKFKPPPPEDEESVRDWPPYVIP
jgi:integrase